MAKGLGSGDDSSKPPAVERNDVENADGWSADQALELHRLIAVRPNRSAPPRPDDGPSPASQDEHLRKD